ncbi:MAG: hypothetical protein HKN87_07665 [Saprospiraceae bacterium]|nr:hypothetical protein [Saprospiraceae bacterium]
MQAVYHKYRYTLDLANCLRYRIPQSTPINGTIIKIIKNINIASPLDASAVKIGPM